MLLRRLYWAAYIASHLRGQGGWAFQPPPVIRRAQSRRLRRILSHAYRHVPHYQEAMRRLGLTPADFHSADDLARLPLIEREQVQRDPERFYSRAIPDSQCLLLPTSGSCGVPIRIRLDLPALFQSAAHTGRERANVIPILGRSFGYREALIAPDVAQTTLVLDFCHKHAWFPPGRRVQRRIYKIAAPLAHTAAELNNFKPDLLFSYGSYIDMLLAHARASGAPFHYPKAITYSADAMSPAVRRLLLEELRIPVFAWYRAVEAFNMGQECDHHRGIHLNIDLHPLRLVDAEGRPVPAGEQGDVVVSNLVNRATVLLNYRLGDRAAMLPDPCSCGRSLPLLSFPPGRGDDFVVLPSGELAHCATIHVELVHGEPVWAAQVVQVSPSHFDVVAVPRERCDPSAMAARLAHRLSQRLHAEFTVSVTFADSLPRTPGGKCPLFVSKVPRPGQPAR
ncbi:MAG TPA: hypothetical protein PLE19_10520 [Planctomycetota bacterium]|nr:hypothetical protein [Planctomycetota bacterium]HRR81661.1 hypothetical protein [Planctomycetota bacterium]HRT95399.1 hypothetical protein [Planctomycetota bacterium]